MESNILQGQRDARLQPIPIEGFSVYLPASEPYKEIQPNSRRLKAAVCISATNHQGGQERRRDFLLDSRSQFQKDQRTTSFFSPLKV